MHIFNQMLNELKAIESNKGPSGINKPLIYVLLNNFCPCFIVGVKLKVAKPIKEKSIKTFSCL